MGNDIKTTVNKTDAIKNNENSKSFLESSEDITVKIEKMNINDLKSILLQNDIDIDNNKMSFCLSNYIEKYMTTTDLQYFFVNENYDDIYKVTNNENMKYSHLYIMATKFNFFLNKEKCEIKMNNNVFGIFINVNITNDKIEILKSFNEFNDEKNIILHKNIFDKLEKLGMYILYFSLKYMNKNYKVINKMFEDVKFNNNIYKNDYEELCENMLNVNHINANKNIIDEILINENNLNHKNYKIKQNIINKYINSDDFKEKFENMFPELHLTNNTFCSANLATCDNQTSFNVETFDNNEKKYKKLFPNNLQVEFVWTRYEEDENYKNDEGVKYEKYENHIKSFVINISNVSTNHITTTLNIERSGTDNIKTIKCVENCIGNVFNNAMNGKILIYVLYYFLIQINEKMCEYKLKKLENLTKYKLENSTNYELEKLKNLIKEKLFDDAYLYIYSKKLENETFHSSSSEKPLIIPKIDKYCYCSIDIVIPKNSFLPGSPSKDITLKNITLDGNKLPFSNELTKIQVNAIRLKIFVDYTEYFKKTVTNNVYNDELIFKKLENAKLFENNPQKKELYGKCLEEIAEIMK